MPPAAGQTRLVSRGEPTMIDFDLGIQRGYEWARASANATQLEHLAREVFRPKSIFDVARFLGVKATTLLVDHLEDSLVNSSQFAEGFITGGAGRPCRNLFRTSDPAVVSLGCRPRALDGEMIRRSGRQATAESKGRPAMARTAGVASLTAKGWRRRSIVAGLDQGAKIFHLPHSLGASSASLGTSAVMAVALLLQ